MDIPPMAQYLASIEARDRREQIHRRLIDQYSKLAIRSSLAATQAKLEPTAHPGSPKNTSLPPPADQSQDANSLRTALASAQAARSSLEARVAALTSLESTNARQAATLTARERDIAGLQRKLRDRGEEVKEGRKLAARVQDENAVLELQLDQTEQKLTRLEAENTELVKRCMDWKKAEADKMNDASKW